jgi:RimJ/RimL family protein N-acetyltransferase
MDLFIGQVVYLTHIEREAYLPALQRWNCNAELIALADFDPAYPKTDEDSERWYEFARQAKDGFEFSIRTLANDEVVGSCGLFGINQRNRSAEFGIVIGENAHWGKGYGSDTARVALRFAFEELGLNRVFLDVLATNQRAVRSYEKVGFVHECTRRQAVWRDGVYNDAYRMGILQDEWVTSISRDTSRSS